MKKKIESRKPKRVSKSRRHKKSKLPMVDLTVTVSNGVAPDGIHVIIDKIGGGYHNSFMEPLSFTHQFNLGVGNYLLTVHGVNPKPSGKTKVEVTGPFKKGPTPSSPQEQSTEQFIFNFFFTV